MIIVIQRIDIFQIFVKNRDCGYSLERLTEVALTCIYDLCSEQKKRKNITIFHLKITIFTSVKNHGILHGCVIVMLTVVSCNQEKK